MSAGRADYPALLFVHQGTVAAGEAFFAEHWPEARAVSDPELRLYDLFGVLHTQARDVLRPELWRDAVRATLQGHRQGLAQGEIRRLPGLFLVKDGRIVWEHPYRHAGDHPDWAALPELARAAAAAEGAPGG